MEKSSIKENEETKNKTKINPNKKLNRKHEEIDWSKRKE